MSLCLKQNKMSASEVLTLFPFKWSRFFWGYWQIFVHVLNISHNVIFLFKYILILKSLYFCLVFQCKCAPLFCICFSMVFFSKLNELNCNGDLLKVVSSHLIKHILFHSVYSLLGHKSLQLPSGTLLLMPSTRKLVSPSFEITSPPCL